MPVYRPLIGITADVGNHPEEAGERAYMVRCNYIDAVVRWGAMAIILPYDTDLAADYVAKIDGLVVTGGRFYLPPEWYGGALGSPTSVIKPDRSLAERAYISAALAVDLPVLGICNGMQLLGVMQGAQVIEHIPDEVPDAVEHMAPDTVREPRHEIRFEPDSRLRELVGVETARVNSVHHQALRHAPGMQVAAVATDGVIEAIEIPGHDFCVGLQWHPEYAVSPADTAIIEGFVAASATYRGRRRGETV